MLPSFEEPPVATAVERWPVSSRSLFGDAVWRMDRIGARQYRRAGADVLKWAIPLPDGATLLDPQHAELLHTCKLLVVLLRTQPGDGRRALRLGSLSNVYQAFRRLLPWMLAHGYRHFRELDGHAVRQYARHLATPRRPGDRPPADRLVDLRLGVLVRLYEYRHRLPDAPLVHPLGGEAVGTSGGLAVAQDGARHAIPPIPDDLAVQLVGAARTWILEYGPVIREAERAVFDPSLRKWVASPKHAQSLRYRFARGYRLRAPIQVDGRTLVELGDVLTLRRLREYLAYACYVAIASHTGMRASEIAALPYACLETEPVRSGRPLLFLHSRLFKTAATEEGVAARWVAGRDHPNNLVRAAVETLQQMDQLDNLEGIVPRDGSGSLWPEVSTHGRGTLGYDRFTAWTNLFAAAVGLPRAWTFSSHQFRKTFARWIVVHHRVDLLALREHFKHLSSVMTQGYVGDAELTRWIGSAQVEESILQLGTCLRAERLAGQASQQILAHNGRFRGEAGREAALAYATEMVQEGYTVIANEYGVCLYDPETARCQGDADRIGADTCLGCPNALFGPQHAPFWRIRRAETVALRESLAALPNARPAVAALDQKVVLYDGVLAKLEGGAAE